MKNFINTVKITAATVRMKAQYAVYCGCTFSRRAMTGNAGEGYIDTAIKILISVVLGALLLYALYALFGDTVLPKLESAINDMFGFGGAVDNLG